MERRPGPAPTAAAGPAPAGPADRRQPELDLDRLVWDPEYRDAMRPWLRLDR